MGEQEGKTIFTFTPSKDFLQENITIKQISGGECFVLLNVLTKSECEQIIKQGEDFGFEKLQESYNSSYRNNERIINYNQKLSDTIWNRVKDYVDNTIILNGHHDTLHTTPHTDGTWEKFGLNEMFRLCKYNPTNFFKEHYDEGYHPEPKSFRTMKTCMIYLNEDFSGGETIFYIKNMDSVKLKLETGMCLIFNQKILHEGATVTSGFKYFIRSDIYYKKTKGNNTELTETELEAIKLYKFGLEQKNAIDALCYYKEATKLCSNVADLAEHF